MDNMFKPIFLYLGFKQYGENYQKYEDIKKFFEENPYAQGKTVERTGRVEPGDKEPWEKKF